MSVGTGGGTASGGAVGTSAAVFQISLEKAAKIATVVSVEWSIDRVITSATIEFGRSGNAEFSVPVDLTAPNYHTLLLGMKMDTEYTVRVVAKQGDETYVSDPQTIRTGFLPNGLPPIQVNDVGDASKIYGGFTVTCNGVGTGVPGQGPSGDAYALIFDRDGDYVWALSIAGTPVGECTRARFSYDGKWFWVGNFNNVNTKGALRRLSLDGENVKDFSLPGRHHDFTVLPNGNVLFHEQENGGGTIGSEGADIVKELEPENGSITELYDERDDFADIADDVGAHTNYITYVPDLQAFSISMRHSDTIALLSYPAAELLGVFSGVHDQFGVSWDAQHGHQFFGDHLLIFNNADDDTQSHVLEYQFNLAQKSATALPTYLGGEKSIAFGDVQRLPNGNTFVTYSNAGIMHEIDSNRTLLREVTLGAVGYASHRKSLYGEEERP